jgi:hypothetical protein
MCYKNMGNFVFFPIADGTIDENMYALLWFWFCLWCFTKALAFLKNGMRGWQ